MSTTTYPEHRKLAAISDKSQAIGEFLAWLEEGGLDDNFGPFGAIELYYHDPKSSRRLLLNMSKSRLLEAYFGIDRTKLEDERGAMHSTNR